LPAEGLRDSEIFDLFKSVLKIVDHAQGRGANRLKSGAYTKVFEHFESVCNKAIGR
jgi:hypothetical protein